MQLLSNLDDLVSKKGKVWSMTKLLSVPTSLSDLDNLVIWSPVQAIHVMSWPLYVFFKSAIFAYLISVPFVPCSSPFGVDRSIGQQNLRRSGLGKAAQVVLESEGLSGEGVAEKVPSCIH